MTTSRSLSNRNRDTWFEITAKELLQEYDNGERNFRFARANGIDLRGANLIGSSFYGAKLRGANFRGADLTYVQFKSADLSCACFTKANLGVTDLIGAGFIEADLSEADLTGAYLARADLSLCTLHSTNFNNVSMMQAVLNGAKLDWANINGTHFDDVDVSAFCGAKNLRHGSPSNIDARTVMRSYTHPHFKRFMLDCGVPELFATYMIDCARALDEPVLRSLMQSTFISYGGPDTKFARRVYEMLRNLGVVTFFFPEQATLGERINNEVFNKLQEHDRILLICSRNSLNRPGVVNEIQETLDREARDGGATYLLPITLDDYVFNEWREAQPVLSERISRRIVGDFRKARRNKIAFEKAMERVADALKKKNPRSDKTPLGLGSDARPTL